jgi:siroheme synthase (precorrin-2 oxidase/ferrochelatase)
VPENIAVKARIEELIDLTDEEAAALVRELRETVKSDRRPFLRRVVALRAILAKLRLETVGERGEPPEPRKIF